MELGIVPISLFSDKSRISMFWSEFPAVDGRWPESSFAARVIRFTVDKLKMAEGIWPVNLLWKRRRFCRFCRLPISSGISPARMPTLRSYINFELFNSTITDVLININKEIDEWYLFIIRCETINIKVNYRIILRSVKLHSLKLNFIYWFIGTRPYVWHISGDINFVS